MISKLIIAVVTVQLAAAPSWAGEAPEKVYTTASNYVAQAFAGSQVPTQAVVWPDKALRVELESILGHKPGLRFKYWGSNGKTVWILDEIGKDRPITAAVSIEHDKIQDIQVLVFRESRGWEVKYDFFTNQFARLGLGKNNQLDSHIDNITGATLSVKAMKRMARAALKLHQHSNQANTKLASLQ